MSTKATGTTTERFRAFTKVSRLRDSYGRMRMELYKTAPTLNVYSTSLNGDRLGAYDSEYETILIDRCLDLDVKKCVLVHELIHWVYDDDSRPPYGARRETDTKRLTAATLIGQNAYMRAETMYDGDIYLMASELNVYPDIITDYQQLVIPTLVPRSTKHVA